MFKKINLKFIGLGALILVLGLFLYVAWVVTTIPIDSNLFTKSSYNDDRASAGLLEAGSYIEEERFRNFFNFLEGESFKKWKKAAIGKGEIEVEKNRIYFLKTIILPSAIKNHCTKIYCLQNRLPFEQIPSVFWKGLIGVEDNRFVSHSGVDLKSILRAIVTDIKKMRLEQGGSTLTQQLIKNLYLSNDKKFIRKIKEIILSLYFENKFSKEEILEIYFNEIEWGSLQGVKIKGIHAAVLMYFNKRMSEVSAYEAAIIISMLKGPYYYSPLRNNQRLRKRADIVFNKLIQLDLFSRQDYQWGDEDWANWLKDLSNHKNEFSYMSFWRTEKENFKKTAFEKFTMIYSSMELLKKIKKKTGDKDIAIKFFLGDVNGSYEGGFYSKYERSKESALNEEYHQIGSTIKPILHNIYREQGVLKEDLVKTGPITFKLKSGIWNPRDATKKIDKEVPVEQALLKSLNRATLRLAQSIGFEIVETKLESYITKIKKPLSEYPAQLLGAIELSVEELFQVYKKFFIENCINGESENWIIEKLSDPTNTTIKHAVSEELRQMKFFGKTGTTNNGYDNWFVGFDGNELMIIWVGFEGVKNTKDLKIYGSSSAFILYQNYISNRAKRFGDMLCKYSEIAL